MRDILITGAKGSLGTALAQRLAEIGGCFVICTDIDGLDVRSAEFVRGYVSDFDLVYHLAGAKHAPEGELDPWHVVETNIIGTRNILNTGVRTILASTCKAADPETVYGASKLIAERMTLEAGGSVARFYNVRESCGNVFETWRGIPDDEPLPVTDCWRYFITLERAVELLVWTADQPPGRYTVKPQVGNWMFREALMMKRPYTMIPRRRGDRKVEPRYARAETVQELENGFEKIICAHDAVPEAVCA